MQKITIFALVLFTVVTCDADLDSKILDRIKNKFEKLKCKGKLVSWETHKDAFITCAGNVGLSNPEDQEGGDIKGRRCKLGKFRSCLAKELNVIKDGKFQKEAFEKFFQDLYPGEIGEGLGKFLSERCATDENTKTIGDPEQCDVISPMGKCIRQNRAEYCGQEGGNMEMDEELE